MNDQLLQDAHAALLMAITELKEAGIPVPMALYLAAHALAYGHRGECRVLPFKPRAEQ